MPLIDRRTVIAGLGALALPRLGFGWNQQSPFKWTPLGPDAWMVDRGGGNTTVLKESGGAVVIDLKVGGVGFALAREIAARVGPIQAVVITHHHGDHSEGLHAFATERSYAHRAGADRIRADLARTAEAARKTPDKLIDALFENLARDFEFPRNPETEPDIRRFVEWAATAAADAQTPRILVGDRAEIPIGSTTLEVIHAGPAHTDNDIFAVDRRRKLVIAGDLLFHRHHPFVDKDAGATTVGWQQVIDRMLAAAPAGARVVPGHGPVTGVDGLREQRRYFDVVRDIVQRARREGRTRKEITALPDPRYPSYGFADLWPANLGVLYDESAG